MKKYFVGIAFIGIFISVLYIIPNWYSKDTKLSTDMVMNEEQKQEVQWKTYKNTEYGFSLEIPENWNVKQALMAHVEYLFIGPPYGSDYLGFDFRILRNPKSIDIVGAAVKGRTIKQSIIDTIKSHDGNGLLDFPVLVSGLDKSSYISHQCIDCQIPYVINQNAGLTAQISDLIFEVTIPLMEGVDNTEDVKRAIALIQSVKIL